MSTYKHIKLELQQPSRLVVKIQDWFSEGCPVGPLSKAFSPVLLRMYTVTVMLKM